SSSRLAQGGRAGSGYVKEGLRSSEKTSRTGNRAGCRKRLVQPRQPPQLSLRPGSPHGQFAPPPRLVLRDCDGGVVCVRSGGKAVRAAGEVKLVGVEDHDSRSERLISGNQSVTGLGSQTRL